MLEVWIKAAFLRLILLVCQNQKTQQTPVKTKNKPRKSVSFTSLAANVALRRYYQFIGMLLGSLLKSVKIA
jgi:hypothetical protein